MISINWFLFSSIFLTTSCVFLAILILKNAYSQAHRTLGYFYCSLFIWGLGATLISITLIPTLSESFWRFACIGATFTAIVGSHALISFTNYKLPRIFLFLYLFGLGFSYLLLFTNSLVGPPLKNYYINFLVFSPGKLYFYWFLFWVLAISIGHYFLIKHSLKNENKNDRKLILCFAPGFFSGMLNFLSPFNFPLFQFANFGITIHLFLIAYFLLKNQLLGIRIVYKKSLLYSILITIFTGIYLLLIICFEGIFKGILGYKSFLTSLSMAFIMSILFNPIKNQIQSFIDRIFMEKNPQEIIKENILLKQMLEKSERLKTASILALGVAHEIKNPLTTLKTFTEFLPQKYSDKNFIEKFSQLIPKEIERINHIVHQLLDFSKPKPPILKAMNIYKTIKEILELMSNDFLKRRISVIEQFDNCGLITNIDAGQIKQVFFNILINAMDSMTKSGNIYISTKAIDGSVVEITIRDQGCGISKENLKNIFNPFFSTKDEGNGLGLAIAHQIIKNHNGTINVTSELNIGTTVIIRLPRA